MHLQRREQELETKELKEPERGPSLVCELLCKPSLSVTGSDQAGNHILQ